MKDSGCVGDLVDLLGVDIGVVEARKVYDAFSERFRKKFGCLESGVYKKLEYEHFENYLRAYYKLEVKK